MTAASRAKTAALLALASLAVLKLGALEICPGGRCHTLAIDTQWLTALHGLRTPTLDAFFHGVTWAGSLYVLLPLALLLAFFQCKTLTFWQRAFLPLALITHWPVVHAAKLLVARPRPNLYEPLTAMPLDASFPSAHAAQITALACAWLLRPGQRTPPWLAVTLVLAVLGVALSRLYLQVHFPSDVLFAIASTILWVLALRYTLDAMQDHP